ncbi:hypothetical protein LTR10_024027 [Elasticomyces elasticus]|nr:hypothetical protein LTR10_024027 [Elasticomyces elasticus]
MEPRNNGSRIEANNKVGARKGLQQEVVTGVELGSTTSAEGERKGGGSVADADAGNIKGLIGQGVRVSLRASSSQDFAGWQPTVWTIASFLVD